MITWRMEVKDETFTNLRDHPSVGQDYITPDDGVATLDDFSVDGAGNCLEATFRASPKFVDIRPRDIVSLEVSEDDGTTWTPVYRGYVVTAGNPRSKDIQQYKLVGLRQRFFEITNTLTGIYQNDVADQAEELFTYINDEGDWPAGVVNSVPTIPTTGFINGNVLPIKESYGDTFKKIAESAGRFIVNIGDTYTYDGVTYNEDDTVLGVKFGVDASGNAFFRRPQGNTVTYTEGDDGLVANYVQVTGEEVFDTIELVYASEAKVDDVTRYTSFLNYVPGDFDFVGIPLTRSFSFGSLNAKRTIQLDEPDFLLVNDVVFVSDSGATNPTGAITGGTTTLPNGSSVAYESPNALDDGFILQFDVRQTQVDVTGDFVFDIGSSFFGSNPYGEYNGAISLDYDTDFLTVRFVVLPLANFGVLIEDQQPGTKIEPEILFENRLLSGAGTVPEFEIKNLQILIPEVDLGGSLSQQFASGFVRDVQQDVAEVKVVGELGTVADRMNWTPTNESEVTVPVERIQYTLTPRDGLVTTYELGQAYDAEALSQRKVLKDLAREAVSE